MLKNITVGQYVVGDSFLHKGTPKTKLLITFANVFIIFLLDKIITYVFGFLVVAFLYKICKIPLKLLFNNLKSVALILVITSIINLFFSNDGEVVFELWFLKITKESLSLTVLVMVRIFFLISSVAILTYTTLPLDLSRSIGDLFLPLKRFNFPVGEISTMLSISIRFVPLLVSETEKIIFAQKSRGADVDSKNIKKKIKFIMSIIVPLIVSSFKRADELAVAMESRCYKIGGNRTRYITFKFNRNDVLLIICSLLFFAALFLVNAISFL